MATLQLGSKGADVIALQQALNKYFAAKYGAGNTIVLNANGDFDINTDKAVRQFQSENGLHVDGAAGTNTMAKLNAMPNPVTTPATTTPVTPAAPANAGPLVSFVGADMERFVRITSLVIDNLEGGYYNPNMNSPTGKLGKYYPALASSGETMYGIDRLNGKGALGNNPAWNLFWGMMDKANAGTAWAYNYRGGALQPDLTKLAVEIMAPQFVSLVKTYLKNNWGVIAGDDRLVFHFSYATWNGAGWFRKFANDIAAAIAAGHTDPNYLAQVAINSRTKEGLTPGSPPNSLILQTGNKIAALFKTMS